MSAKKTPVVDLDGSLDFTKWNEILKLVFDKVDHEPPVGERYEHLLRQVIRSACEEVMGNLLKSRRVEIEEKVFAYVADYGPIQVFLDDPDVSEIMVNGPHQVYIERLGDLIETDVMYDNARHVRFAINHIINPTGRFVNIAHPTVDSRLPDGSRVNIVIPPVSQQGPCITIRKFLKDKLTLDQLINLGSLSEQMAQFLTLCVKGHLNIIVAGNTSSGKTTLLNILAGHIHERERIITIEDSAELALQQSHKLSLEAQPPDHHGQGGISVRELVRNALRMRPDRIIIGEVRGGETIDMLQAMNTGHDGSMATIHSNSARDTVSRLETTALMAGIDMPIMAIRRQIASALELVVHLSRLPDGSRKITQITEVVGMEGDIITLTDLYLFEQMGVDPGGKIKGRFRPTGLRPQFSATLESHGCRIDPALLRM